MRSVKQICDELFELAPDYMKESWDNVGLLCGHADSQVEKVLVALDPTLEVAMEAKACGAQLIVTHHPLIFGSIQSVRNDNGVGNTLLYLIENGIAAVNMHTNLDSAVGGVNDCLAAALGLRNTAVLMPGGQDACGNTYGLGRTGEINPCELSDFLQVVKDRLNCNGLRYVEGTQTVHNVAVGGGSCGDFLKKVKEIGCDTFVTADVKYNQFLDAREMGINLIDAGHFATENPVCSRIAERLKVCFPDVTVVVSQRHGDVTNFL